ncbi:MAG: glycerol acyltransferase [Pedobacter sp.]|nr:MAG: glycerol acyltransferase [Pedobacter sp.]
MIIKGKPLNSFSYKFICFWVELILKVYLRKINLRAVEIKPGHSYLLLSNHFSFMDGLFAFYISRKLFYKNGYMRHLHIMSLKQQMLKNPWLKWVGSFSVDPGKLSLPASFSYAAEILSKPGNMLLFYPQGNLESLHIRKIHFEDGINQIIPQVQGPCQIIWTSNIVEYFEGIRPTITCNLLDCGLISDYDMDSLEKKINLHHQNALDAEIRFTTS